MMIFLLLVPLTLALVGLVHQVFTLADSLTRWPPEPPATGPGPAPGPVPPGLDFDDIRRHLSAAQLTPA